MLNVRYPRQDDETGCLFGVAIDAKCFPSIPIDIETLRPFVTVFYKLRLRDPFVMDNVTCLISCHISILSLRGLSGRKFAGLA